MCDQSNYREYNMTSHRQVLRIGLLSTLNSPTLGYILKELLDLGVEVDAIILDPKLESVRDQQIHDERTDGQVPLIPLESFTETPPPCFFVDNHNSKTTTALVRRMQIDLLLNAGTPRILKPEILESPAIGVLNCHPGLLPKFRGCTSVEWALYLDEPVGVTVHLMSEGIDEGPILMQREVPVSKGDRYAYALREDQLTDSSFLMMVDLDEDGIVTAKYYWEWIATPQFLAKLESWEMAMDVQIPASVLQEYTANLGPKEEAILEYLGGRLRDIATHFEHLKQLFGATASMKRILTMAATEYNMRADKQALLSERGFVFDGDVFGGKCTISLKPIDERAGWYFLVLKGHRIKNFFSGW